LSTDNRSTLDRQLKETYGESVENLNRTNRLSGSIKLKLRKIDIPPIVITKTIRKLVESDEKSNGFQSFDKPDIAAETMLVRKIYTPDTTTGDASILHQIDEEEVISEIVGSDLFTTATKLSAVYRLDALKVYKELKRIYEHDEIIPNTHFVDLSKQIENQILKYEIQFEEVDIALALVKPQGFDIEKDPNGDLTYTTEITYRKDREHLLTSYQDLLSINQMNLGFHYDPYNFDSSPEQDFFEQMLRAVNLDPEEIEDIYFTGGLTDPKKTEFFVEYKGDDNKWHRYSPDFVVRKKNGRCCIVEIKAERERNNPIDGENGLKAAAVQAWEKLNPDKLRYEMIFTDTDNIAFNKLESVRQFIKENQKND
jgi:hypothetical protein